jgi:hypothetical protein
MQTIYFILIIFFAKIKTNSLYAFYSSSQNTEKGVMNMKKAVFFIVLILLASTGSALAAPPEAAVEEEVIQAYVQKAIEICH